MVNFKVINGYRSILKGLIDKFVNNHITGDGSSRSEHAHVQIIEGEMQESSLLMSHISSEVFTSNNEPSVA